MSSSRRSRSRRLKQILANLFVGVLGVVALLLLVGLFLPRYYRVERSISISAKPAAVFAEISNLRRWPEWTAWNEEMDSTVEFAFEGPEAGVGAEYRWNGKQLGKGHLKLTKAHPEKGVWYELDFNQGQFPSTGALELLSGDTGGGVRVVWVNEGDLGKNPVNRYMGLMMDRMVGPDFEKGLGRLKARVEGGGGGGGATNGVGGAK